MRQHLLAANQAGTSAQSQASVEIAGTHESERAREFGHTMERSSSDRSDGAPLRSVEGVFLDNGTERDHGRGLARRRVCLHDRPSAQRSHEDRVGREVLRLRRGVDFQVLGFGVACWM